MNIITSTLTLDEFYRIFVSKANKEMREIFKVTHKDTKEVKKQERKHL